MPRRGSGLRIERRPDTGALTIVGTVAGERIRKRAQSDNYKLAQEEEAAAIETELLRTQWHGPRRGTRPLRRGGDIVHRNPAAFEQSPWPTEPHLVAAGETKLKDVNQKPSTDRPGCSPRRQLRDLRARRYHAVCG